MATYRTLGHFQTVWYGGGVAFQKVFLIDERAPNKPAKTFEMALFLLFIPVIILVFFELTNMQCPLDDTIQTVRFYVDYFTVLNFSVLYPTTQVRKGE